MMDWITNPEIWISLVTLTVLEIVLGIDNVIFISILSGKLPEHQQAKARQTGLMLALITRIMLLCALAWMVKLTAPLFHLPAFASHEPHPVSGRDLILLVGGLFLVGKATYEIHDKLEVEHEARSGPVGRASFAAILIQILLLDIVFSLDSVITAVGMARQLGVMIAAVIIALVFMLFFAGRISGFIHKHPSLKVLAEFPHAYRLRADCGRLPQGDSQGLHLLRHGVLRRRGMSQHPNAREAEGSAGHPSPALPLIGQLGVARERLGLRQLSAAFGSRA